MSPIAAFFAAALLLCAAQATPVPVSELNVTQVCVCARRPAVRACAPLARARGARGFGEHERGA
jgi:hypothetical protein